MTEQLYYGKPVILCVENFEHWVCAIGLVGNRVVVFDPSNFKKNKYENGVHVWGRKHLMYKWWNTRKSIDDETEKRLYAISVGTK